jgi:hypothetical protein
LAKIAENWRKSPKIGENRRKSAKIGENRRKSPKIAENRRKSPKIAIKTLAPRLRLRKVVVSSLPAAVKKVLKLVSHLSKTVSVLIGKFGVARFSG